MFTLRRVAVSGLFFVHVTHHVVDLVLNSLGLVFILELDELMFLAFVPTKTQAVIDKIMHTRIHKHLLAWRQRFNYCRGETCEMVSFGIQSITISLAVRFLQIFFAAYKFNLIAGMCLYMGANPDNRNQYNGVFPVVGFCESLLDLKCELPDQWKSQGCLYGNRQTLGDACASYSEPVGNQAWEAWSRQNHEGLYCVSQSGDGPPVSVSSLFQKYVDELDSFVSKIWFADHERLLKLACLAMWQKAPYLNVSDAYRQDFIINGSVVVNEDPQPPHPPIYVYKPFPRMRFVGQAEALFAAPFGCPYRVDSENHLALLGEDGPAPLTLEGGKRLWKICGVKPMQVVSGRRQGELCAIHRDCACGFCSKHQKRCDCSHCRNKCQRCDEGAGDTCGSNCPEPEAGKVCAHDNKPGRITDPHIKYQVLRQPSKWKETYSRFYSKWFYSYGGATAVTQWEPPANCHPSCFICAGQGSDQCLTCRVRTPIFVPAASFSGKEGSCVTCPVFATTSACQTVSSYCFWNGTGCQTNGCMWQQVRMPEENQLLCEDGELVENWRCKTPIDHGRRMACPVNFPTMCAKSTCGLQEYCCEKNCSEVGGARVCQVFNYSDECAAVGAKACDCRMNEGTTEPSRWRLAHPQAVESESECLRLCDQDPKCKYAQWQERSRTCEACAETGWTMSTLDPDTVVYKKEAKIYSNP